jgi:hypothetical protein
MANHKYITSYAPGLSGIVVRWWIQLRLVLQGGGVAGIQMSLMQWTDSICGQDSNVVHLSRHNTAAAGAAGMNWGWFHARLALDLSLELVHMQGRVLYVVGMFESCQEERGVCWLDQAITMSCM